MPASAVLRRALVALPVLLASVLIFTLGAGAPADAAQKNERAIKIHHGLNVAIKQKGDPYSYGSAGPRRFDCSGLTMYSYGKAGLYLPRSASSQYHFVRHIPKKKLRRGDLIFFHSGRSVYHVAIFLGRHDHRVWILHAPHTGTVVKRDPIWTHSWWAGTLRHRP